MSKKMSDCAHGKNNSASSPKTPSTIHEFSFRFFFNLTSYFILWSFLIKSARHPKKLVEPNN